jgi:exosome complex component CSL4
MIDLAVNKGELMTKEKIVLPGEKVSTSEELLPGDGTYEENGIIWAARYGEYVVDNKHRRAMVKPLTNVPIELKNGDIVLAEARSVRSNMVIAEVIHVIGKDKAISGDTNGTLKVSEISKGYVKDPATEYSLGDIIRAQVIQTKPSIQLTTKGKNFGVIKAICSKCRHPLEEKGNILECRNCKNKEKRNRADDYGKYDLKKL